MSVLVERKRLALELSPPHSDRLLDLAAVGFPALLGLVLCLIDLSTRSLWLDEAASITIASQHGAAFGNALAHDGGNMLGYYALLHVLIGAFGSGALVARLPSALAASATIGLTALIGLRLWDRRIAVVGGVLGAVSLPFVYWGQDARGYMLMIALVCASFLLLVVALQRPRPGWALWLGYVAVNVGAVYMGLEAALVFSAQLLVLIWHRRHARWVISGLIVSALCCIPLAILALGRGSAQIFWIPTPDAFTTKQVLLTLTSGGLEPQFYSTTGDVAFRITEVLGLFGLAAITWMLVGSRTRGRAWRPVLVAGWLFLPPVLSWVISELGHSMFEARYLLMSLPAVALMLAWMLVGMARPSGAQVGAALARSRWHLSPGLGPPISVFLRVVAAVLLIGLLTLRALQVAPAYGVSTEPWRGVTKHVLASSRPGDCIAFYPLDARMPFRYYLPAGAQPPRSILPTLPWSNDGPFVEAYSTLKRSALTQDARQCRRVWLLSGHQGRGDGTAQGQVHYANYQQLVSRLNSLYAHATSRTYGAAQIITLQLFSDPQTGRGHGSRSRQSLF
jgi:mannosyltransferase